MMRFDKSKLRYNIYTNGSEVGHFKAAHLELFRPILREKIVNLN